MARRKTTEPPREALTKGSATHDGEIFGIAPTGRRVRIAGGTFTRLGPDGLVAEDVHFTGRAGLLAQLGIG